MRGPVEVRCCSTIHAYAQSARLDRMTASATADTIDYIFEGSTAPLTKLPIDYGLICLFGG